MRERYGDRVFSAEVGINVRLAELPGVGRDIFDLDPAARGARAYLAVATELIQRARGAAPVPAARPAARPPALVEPEPEPAGAEMPVETAEPLQYGLLDADGAAPDAGENRSGDD
jgi:hypothetical protein